MDRLLLRSSPFGAETGALPIGEFEPGEEASARAWDALMGEDCKILVIGAGGLGCELLKDLALSGCRDITVIDVDTIDLSNLNRQFLFRMKDVGRPKAVVAAEFIEKRVPGCKVAAHHAKIQDFDGEFYSQFSVVVSGLDNVEARRWMNSMLCSLAEIDDDGNVIDPDTIIPFVDGGTEGFKGHARVILPRHTSCFECSLDLFPPQRVFPMCTIADTPRLPEHCISYAHLLQWPQAFPDKKLDKDDPEHMKWIHERAQERAEQHQIPDVTYMLTVGVVKNVIPAVASTNAVVSAACALEVVKLVTYAGHVLNTYLMYNGVTGVYGSTMALERRADCVVCGAPRRTFRVPAATTLRAFIADHLGGAALKIRKPSVTHPSRVLFMQAPPALRAQTEPNLDLPLSELCADGDELTVTDPAWGQGTALGAVIKFS
ncbi:hypothetical protein JKP88DRAFT_161436 [Tribonema minus]|uniref:NEDD8-activating enzyme E1 catalytic subunit n=1 Tax=Tribonema minus TaxID=303371 RepID=A0A835ZFD4_9STRA|nr:hypothetical protein JKP88DRAFT_161436 [Tribonema minus]